MRYADMTDEQKARRRETKKRWKKANPEKHREQKRRDKKAARERDPSLKREENRRYRRANPDKVRATAKRHADKYPEERRERRLKYLGFGPGTFELALRVQSNRCAICSADFAGMESKRIHADHDHATGRARGVLCGNCNVAIGLLKESPERLLAAVRYLEHPPLDIFC